MPTMSQPRVSTLPMVVHSEMSLYEIRAAMKEKRPDIADFRGGWASVNDLESQLRVPGGVPPESDPEIIDASDVIPERLNARYYYWDSIPSKINDQSLRQLNAIDCVITRVDERRVGLLFSTRTMSYIRRGGGIAESLESIFNKDGGAVRVVKSNASHLELYNQNIFLWLMVQLRDRPQLNSWLKLDTVDEIASQDSHFRTASLGEGVDLDRPNFLTSVAEMERLGPIHMSVIRTVGDDIRTYKFKLFHDGGFDIANNGFHSGIVQDGSFSHMTDVALDLAFKVIPSVNTAFVEDSENWDTKMPEVIEEAMEVLARRYDELREGLSRYLAE